MIWKGEAIKTSRDLMDKGIDKCSTPEEAQEFMALYRVECPYADINIGYMSGYYGPAKMRQIQEWFGVTHPIFGKTTPSVEEALKAGMELGASNRNSAEAMRHRGKP